MGGEPMRLAMKRCGRVVLISVAVLALFHVGSWLAWGRTSLQHQALNCVERFEEDLLGVLRGSGGALVLTPALARTLETEGEPRKSLEGIRVLSEPETRREGLVDRAACHGCVVLRYEVQSNNPLAASMEVAYWCGALCGEGFTVRL